MSRKIQETRSATSTIPRAKGSHRFAIDYSKADGTPLGAISIEPDFQAAKDWTYFTGMRRGRLPAVTAAAEGVVSPLWSEERGAPFCRGFRVDTPAVDGVESVRCEFPRTYFKSNADRGAWDWVAKGDLEPGEAYTYHVCAYPVAAGLSESSPLVRPHEEASSFEVDVLPDPIPISQSRLAMFHDRATTEGKQFAGDMPVFIARSVLAETCALAKEAGKQETGGVLVGKIHQDSCEPEIFIEVVAQIPAQYAEASGTSFSFSSETWAAADAAIKLRGRNELTVGWWHSHPRFCNPECPKERRKDCQLAIPFFSADDIHLHHVCFPQPYQIALLISDLPETGPTPALFGWRKGMVSTRGYSPVP